jgi:uncharacterized protein (UPF0332 family)
MAIAEWRRATEALGAAETLVHGDYRADSVSRAYYAIMHAAKAGLFVRDVEATSHAGVKRMFGLHLVRPGDIEARWSTYLGEGLDDRLEADYNVFASYSAQQAEQECERAREFLARMRRYLIENGLYEHDLDQDVGRG